MTDRLTLYNAALLECKERKLASLTEECEARRVLDEVWGNGFIDDILNDGQWRFARRSVKLTHETDISVSFGYAYAFPQPTDLVSTVAFCQDERFQVPLLRYQVEAGYWYADIDPIYLTYVSNDANYGGNLSKWPQNFCRYAELYLATRIIPRLTGSKADRGEMDKRLKRLKLDAKNSDSQESPTSFLPQGTWTRSRGSRSRRFDRGSTSQLIG